MSTETPNQQNDQPEPAQMPDAQTLLAELAQKYSALNEEFLRFRAESENNRKRTLKDVENARKFGSERLLSELVPIADTLARGLEIAQGENVSIDVLKEGKEATLRLLLKTMEGHGVKEINPLGEVFNPELHQAMTMQDSPTHAPNTVISVFQRGYTLHERLLRPALVIVSAS